MLFEENIIFNHDDVNLFAESSHDCNPLHCDFAYARKTLYGEPVVHGMLGVLVCIGKFSIANKALTISSIRVQFFKPLFCDIKYTIKCCKTKTGVDIVIVDGNMLILKLELALTKDLFPGVARGTDEATLQLLKHARNWNTEDIKAGTLFSGYYAPKRDSLLDLLHKFGIFSTSMEGVATFLLWSSYWIGMELPGQQALYSSFDLTMNPNLPQTITLPITCKIKLDEFRDQFNLISHTFECYSSQGDQVGYGSMKSFIRPEIKLGNISCTDLITEEDRTAFVGQTALVTGASRGLGAALALLLGSMSCHVIINFKHNHEDALCLKDSITSNGGSAELWQGDVADTDWLQKKREHLTDSGRSLNILICNACPPSLTPKMASLEPSMVGRISDYIASAFQLTSSPLAVFAGDINNNCGTCLTISSEYVTSPKPEFPHYICLKAAVEALTSSLASRYKAARWLIARPPKLLTTMSSGPTGNYTAIEPALIARSILSHGFFMKNHENNSANMEIFSPSSFLAKYIDERQK